MRRISVHSDGTSRGTVVLDEEGKSIAEVSHAAIEIDARDGVAVTLEVGPANINITGNLVQTMFECGVCSVTFDHECDTRLGGGSGSFLPNDAPMLLCPSFIEMRDGHTKHECMREVNHTLKHFDGSTSWSDPLV